MLFGGRAGDVPNLLKPAVKLFFVNAACISLHIGRLPITARFPLHENKLHIILDDGVWFVGLSEKLRSVGDLV